ncbi:unnamed protein product [Sphagnum balticum]
MSQPFFSPTWPGIPLTSYHLFAGWCSLLISFLDLEKMKQAGFALCTSLLLCFALLENIFYPWWILDRTIVLESLGNEIKWASS